MIHLHEQIKYDRECNIIALVYLNRITTANNMALTARNWRMLWLLAVMVAQKVRDSIEINVYFPNSHSAYQLLVQVWAHKPVRSGGFCLIYTDLRKSILKRSENAMMAMLDYNTGMIFILIFSNIIDLIFSNIIDLPVSNLCYCCKTFWMVGVPPSLYAKYYLELNELFKGLMDTLQVGDGREVWDWEPVSDFTKALLKRKCQQAEVDRC